MSEFQKLIRKQHGRELAEEAKYRQFAEDVFTEWRDRYVTALCLYMRLHHAVGLTGRTEIMQGPSRDWCNAAVLILTATDVSTQDWFMRSDPGMKDKIVRAVLDDGGIYDLRGFFVELPV